MCSSDRIRFWHFLVPNPENPGRALFDYYTLEELTEKTVVAIETPSKKMAYAVFDNPADLFRHIETLPNESKHFHEVILGWTLQKPRFDIDMTQDKLLQGENLDATAQRVIDLLLDSIIKVLAKDNIDLDIERQVILTSSHSSTKRSFHLILHELVHTNHLEAAAFYERVVEESEDPKFLERFLDAGIYSSNHCLRLLHNNKLNEIRPKKLETSFMFQGQLRHHTPRRQTDKPQLQRFILFYQSLVNYSCYCEIMPVYRRDTFAENNIQLAEGAVARAVEFLAKDMDMKADDLPFQIRDIKGPIIDLKRLAPSYCKTCDRIHEVVDPYLIISGNEFYFHCRRVPKGIKNARHIGSHIDGTVGKFDDFYTRVRARYQVEDFTLEDLTEQPEFPILTSPSVITSVPAPVVTTVSAIEKPNYFVYPKPQPIEFISMRELPPPIQDNRNPIVCNTPMTGLSLIGRMESLRNQERPTGFRRSRQSSTTKTVKAANGKMPRKYTYGYTATTGAGLNFNLSTNNNRI